MKHLKPYQWKLKDNLLFWNVKKIAPHCWAGRSCSIETALNELNTGDITSAIRCLINPTWTVYLKHPLIINKTKRFRGLGRRGKSVSLPNNKQVLRLHRRMWSGRLLNFTSIESSCGWSPFKLISQPKAGAFEAIIFTFFQYVTCSNNYASSLRKQFWPPNSWI